MKIANPALTEILWQLGQNYLTAYQEKFNHLPLAEQDAQWPSPCQVAIYNDEYITWQPCKVSEVLSFDNIETALEMPLHADVKSYYTAMYSESIATKCSEGRLELLLPWNGDDFQRLQENIIGHVLMKQKLKQAITIFFAVTDEEDHIISLNNASGEIWVERVGCEPHKKLAASLTEFLELLTPDLTQLTS